MERNFVLDLPTDEPYKFLPFSGLLIIGLSFREYKPYAPVTIVAGALMLIIGTVWWGIAGQKGKKNNEVEVLRTILKLAVELGKRSGAPRKEKNNEKELRKLLDEMNKKLNIEGVYEVSAQELCEKGFEKLKNNEFKKAIEFFNKAIDINSKYKEAWYGRGVAIEKLGERNYREAIKSFRKVLETDPDISDITKERN